MLTNTKTDNDIKKSTKVVTYIWPLKNNDMEEVGTFRRRVAPAKVQVC